MKGGGIHTTGCRPCLLRYRSRKRRRHTTPETASEYMQTRTDIAPGFHEFLKERGIGDVRSLPMHEREALLEEYLDSMPMPASAVGIAGAIVAIIVGAATIGKHGYDAGRYGAMQAHSKRILTKSQYRARSNYYYWMVLGACTGAFGVTAPFIANGFNDWMWS